MLVGRKALPEKEKVERELVNAQIELKACEQQLRKLEGAVENATNPQRVRLLPGDCPSRNELDSKTEKLEVHGPMLYAYVSRGTMLFVYVSRGPLLYVCVSRGTVCVP